MGRLDILSALAATASIVASLVAGTPIQAGEATTVEAGICTEPAQRRAW